MVATYPDRTHSVKPKEHGQLLGGRCGNRRGSNTPVPSTTTSYSGAISSMVNEVEEGQNEEDRYKGERVCWEAEVERGKKFSCILSPQINEAVRRLVDGSATSE